MFPSLLSIPLGVLWVFSEALVCAKTTTIDVPRTLACSKYIFLGHFRAKTPKGSYYVTPELGHVFRGGDIDGDDVEVWPASSGPQVSREAIEKTKATSCLFVIDSEGEAVLIGEPVSSGFRIIGFNDYDGCKLLCDDRQLCHALAEGSSDIILEGQVLKERYGDRIRLQVEGPQEFILPLSSRGSPTNTSFPLKLTLSAFAHPIAIDFQPTVNPRTAVRIKIQRAWGPKYYSLLNLATGLNMGRLVLRPGHPLTLDLDGGRALTQAVALLNFNYTYLLSIEIDPEGWAGIELEGVLTQYVQSNVLKVLARYE